jgi:hypothetical protein
LVFGLFLAVDLVLFGVVPLESVIVTVLVVVGLFGGLLIGLSAPFGSRSPSAGPLSDAPTTPASPEQAAGGTVDAAS